jgi:hypothetical protein
MTATTLRQNVTDPRGRWGRARWPVAAALVGLMGWCGVNMYNDNHYRVRRLHLGMTRQEVLSVMGPPDCVSRLGGASVLTFLDPAWHTGAACSEVAASYSEPSELPCFYSSVQVVLDREGTVSAFVHVGESERQIRVAHKPGWTLAALPLSALE